MDMNSGTKRGQIYSFIAILLAIPIMIFVSFYIASSHSMNTAAAERVVADQENQLSASIEGDFSRAAEISCRRAMLSAINNILINGDFPANASISIEELVTNGTLEGNASVLMAGNALPDWRDRINSVPTGLLKDFSYSGVFVEGGNTSIFLNAELVINISDNLNISRIDRSFVKHLQITTEGLEDPIFAIKTLGNIRRTVKIYLLSYHSAKVVSGSGNGGCSGNVTFDRLDTGAGKILVIHDGSGVSGFGGVVSETPDVPDVACYIAGAGNAVSLIGGIVNSSGYRKIILDNETRAAWSIPMIEYLGYYSSFSSGGPDFLRRLEGSMSPMAYGMETFAVEEAGLPEKPDQSRVDYLYFSENTYNGNQVRHFPDWFRIDAANAAKYNLTELVK